VQNFAVFTAFILFASVFQFAGCSDTAPDIATPKGEELTAQVETLAPEPVTTEPTPVERTFVRLLNLFPQSIVDADFTTLREVTNSQLYLDFLAQEFPEAGPFQTYEAYLRGAPPDADRYLPFLEKWVGNPSAEDVELIQWLTGKYREVNLHIFRIEFRQGPAVQPGALFQEAAQVFEKLAVLAEDPHVEAFMTRHALRDDFSPAFEAFVAATEREDARWLHEQFEARNGIDEGLLWSALHRPTLIGEILHNFSSTDVFLKWVEVTREQD